MRQRLTIAGLILLMMVVMSGCATTSALHRAKVVGLTAKTTAETAYLTVKIQFLLDQVPPQKMAEAAAMYNMYREAQTAYVAALELWELSGTAPDHLEALKVRIVALAARLHALQVTIEETSDGRRESGRDEPADNGGDGSTGTADRRLDSGRGGNSPRQPETDAH